VGLIRVVRPLVLAVLLAAAVAVAAGAAGRVYRGDLLPQLAAGAAAGSVGLSWACARRLPGWLAAPLSAAALAGYLLFAVRVSARSAGMAGSVPSLLGDALRNGIPRLLGALVPVEPQPDTVVLPLLLVWVAGLASAELALRGGRVVAALAPPTAVYLAGLAFAGPQGTVEPRRAAAFAGLGAALLLVARPGAARTMPGVKVAPASVVRAAGCLLLTVVVVPVVTARAGGTPPDPRALVTVPAVDALDVNPLARLSGWLQNPTQTLLRVRLSTVDQPGEVRLRLAVLDDYDGVVWRNRATYRQAGQVLPTSTEESERLGAAVRQDITVVDLRGGLVPAAAVPRRVEGVRVACATGTGTLLRPGGLHAGDSYSVVSRVPAYDVNLLAVADVPSGPRVAPFLRLDAPPAALADLAASVGRGNGAPYQKAYALAQFLSGHYTLTPDAPSGHAYPNLRFFLLERRELGGQRGTSEQFAAAYAVLGRLLGLPTRVVVGLRAHPGAGTVRGSDALAWPEVLFTGIGWVPFDPLPRRGEQPRAVEEDYRPLPPQPTPSPTAEPSVPPASPSPSTSATAAPSTVAGPEPGGARWPVTALPAVAVGLAVALFGARWARSNRRLTRGSPAQRLRGAWLEVLDALWLAGHRPPGQLTLVEVAQWARRPGLPAIDELAELVNLAAFSGQALDESDTAVAAAQARSYAAALRAGRPWAARLWWRLRPGPLYWRHTAQRRRAER
jgi:transglutaminase-like putative cysteine protease